MKSGNSLFIIEPYKTKNGNWVFDDDSRGIEKEPFVFGADDILERVASKFPDYKNGVTVIFAATPFPEFDVKLQWVSGDENGNTYKSTELDMVGWLCPALFKYFAKAPKEIYFKVKPRQA
jgi:hypothetical protein